VSEESREELLAKFRADADQAAAGVAEVAKIMRAYYTELCEEGFNESQALTLVVSYQSTLFSSLDR
jgi:hypothetical protein